MIAINQQYQKQYVIQEPDEIIKEFFPECTYYYTQSSGSICMLASEIKKIQKGLEFMVYKVDDKLYTSVFTTSYAYLKEHYEKYKRSKIVQEEQMSIFDLL